MIYNAVCIDLNEYRGPWTDNETLYFIFDSKIQIMYNNIICTYKNIVINNNYRLKDFVYDKKNKKKKSKL